ncbi:MAG: PDZ domain-containing protein [Leucobacter sp.]
MLDERRERRRMRMLLGIAVLACLVLLASVVPSPYAIEQPGPVVDTLGETPVDDRSVPVVAIEDAETYPTSGELNLLTVSILGDPDRPQSWLSLVPALFDPSRRVAPVSEFYPSGMTVEQRETENTALMDGSQAQAAAAAFRELGEEVGAQLTVAGVSDGGPADGVLEPGDVIAEIDGEPVADFAALRDRIAEAGAGGELRFGILRDGAERELVLEPRAPEGGEEPLIGVTIATSYELPAQVDINLSQIGGPSAGLVFALAILDRLTPGEMLDGLTVSGTGTMSDDGRVGAIGGLDQKMWAAQRAGSDLFLMPVENCADLPEQLPPGLRIAPVDTLEEAVSAIEAAAAGGEPAGIERCGVEGVEAGG